jgi:alginate production protein
MLSPLLSLLVFCAQGAQVSKPDVLQVGHVVELRGSLDATGRFVTEQAELRPETSDDVLIGTVSEGERDPSSFMLLGQLVVTDDTTTWKGLARGSMAGKRIKVEGSWKGPRKFVANEIAERGPGRDRIAGRLDALERTAGGWRGRMLIFDVILADDTPVEHERDIATYGFAKEHKVGVSSEESRSRNEDDQFGEGIQLGRGLKLSGQLEYKRNTEDEFDLDESIKGDRTDLLLAARARVEWAGTGRLSGQAEVRFNQLFREQQGRDFESDQNALLGETFLAWSEPFGLGDWTLSLGRQDFDDEREWIYDENLDTLRMDWQSSIWSLDLGVGTRLTDGSPRDEEAQDFIAYFACSPRKEHYAAWLVYRDIGRYEFNSARDEAKEKNLHLGLRAIGEFDELEAWGDLAVLSGSREVIGTPSRDVFGYGYDAGATWSPSFADPLYFTLSYALGSGDDSTSGNDGTFRQTGLQDNTSKFGGVTSFQYYGELADPELSNLGILTAGVGARLAKKISLDLVYHTYTQDVATGELSSPPVESNLKRGALKGSPANPGTVADADIGSEFDLIFGFRQFSSWDLELVGAWFQAGDAWLVGDDAFLGKIQLRYRL